MGALGGPTELLVSMIIVTAYRVRSIYCFRWLLLKHLDSSGREQCLWRRRRGFTNWMVRLQSRLDKGLAAKYIELANSAIPWSMSFVFLCSWPGRCWRRLPNPRALKWWSGIVTNKDDPVLFRVSKWDVSITLANLYTFYFVHVYSLPCSARLATKKASGARKYTRGVLAWKKLGHLYLCKFIFNFRVSFCLIWSAMLAPFR